MNITALRVTRLPIGLAAFAASAFLATAAPQPAAAEDRTGFRGAPESFADVAARIKPCVVTVYSEKVIKLPRFQWPFGDDSPFRFFFGDQDQSRQRHPMPREYQFKQGGMGSGIIADKDGRILTNHHVVRDVDEIKVKLPDGATYDAEIVGVDSRSDLAVIKIKGKVPRDLVAATLGDSEVLRVGDWVLAVGAPFGFEQTVTAGIISAKGRTRVDGDRDKYEYFLQTDAAINPGNSGGPLVNMRGEVVGINTAIATTIGQFAGVGLAIPVNMAKHVMHDLIKSGKVTRGYLGVLIQEVTSDLAERFNLEKTRGALVTQITKPSPAEKAGLKVGDVITKYNGTAIDDTGHLRSLVADTAPGASADLTVMRDGKEHALKITVGQLDDKGGQAGTGEEKEREDNFGLTVEPLTADKARDLGYGGETGVLISEVADDSPAADAGIQPGNIITEINRQPVTSVDDFRNALGKSKGKVMLLVKTKDGSRFVVLEAK